MNLNEYTPFPCIVFLNRNHACSYWQLVHVYIHVLLTMSIIHRWEQQHTTGTPPPGVWGYGSCSSGKDIYYFGGYCGHDSCYHNSLFLLNTEKFAWSELFTTNNNTGPMKKAYSGLLAFDDQLLAFGGRSETDPSNPSPLAKYEKSANGWVYTNEHHVFDLKRGEGHFLITVPVLMLINYCTKLRGVSISLVSNFSFL